MPPGDWKTIRDKIENIMSTTPSSSTYCDVIITSLLSLLCATNRTFSVVGFRMRRTKGVSAVGISERIMIIINNII